MGEGRLFSGGSDRPRLLDVILVKGELRACLRPVRPELHLHVLAKRYQIGTAGLDVRLQAGTTE